MNLNVKACLILCKTGVNIWVAPCIASSDAIPVGNIMIALFLPIFSISNVLTWPSHSSQLIMAGSHTTSSSNSTSRTLLKVISRSWYVVRSTRPRISNCFLQLLWYLLLLICDVHSVYNVMLYYMSNLCLYFQKELLPKCQHGRVAWHWVAQSAPWCKISKWCHVHQVLLSQTCHKMFVLAVMFVLRPVTCQRWPGQWRHTPVLQWIQVFIIKYWGPHSCNILIKTKYLTLIDLYLQFYHHL